jgi:hypothetical protein
MEAGNTLASDLPLGWTLLVGTPGTSLGLTDFESQTIVISGTPTTGFYQLELTHPVYGTQFTDLLAFNASGGAVQAAISRLLGFGTVRVTTTGTSPNFTHTVYFNQIPGSIALIQSTNTFDVGSIAHNPGPSVDANGMIGKSLWIEGDGAELTAIEQVLSLRAKTLYAVHVRLRKSASATGVVQVSLRDGLEAVINDDAGNANSASVNLSGVSTSNYSPHSFWFRTPSTLPSLMRLRIALTTAINSGQRLYVDGISVVPASKLPSTDIWVAAISGPLATEPTDTYTMTATNNYAGRLQTAFMRLYNTRLPTSGSPTIADN